jgi:hypothetical protein
LHLQPIFRSAKSRGAGQRTVAEVFQSVLLFSASSFYSRCSAVEDGAGVADTAVAAGFGPESF